MFSPSLVLLRREALAVAIAAALLLSPHAAARTVQPGAPLILDNQQLPAESFTVEPLAQLRLINRSTTGGIAVTAGTVAVESGSSVVSASGPAFRAMNGANVTITDGSIVATAANARGTGLVLSSSNAPGTGFGVVATLLRTNVQGGGGYATTLTSDATLNAGASTFTATGTRSHGIGLFSGTLNLSQGSHVMGQAAGIQIATDSRADADKGRFLTVDGSLVEGRSEAALLVDTLEATTPTDVDIALRNGAVLIGGNGLAIDMRARTHASIDVASSAIEGDIAVADQARAELRLHDAATLLGRVTGDVAMQLDGGTQWTSTGASTIASLMLEGGRVALAPPDAMASQTVNIQGSFGGAGGELVFNTLLGEGGALARQQTDRLLVQGDVTTRGPTLITVRPRGEGALTDSNGNGVVDAAEGISLVQVGGASRADAFALRGGYVAAGPFQYTLHAFGPGQADPTQSALGGGMLNWDYRLGNRYVCERDCGPVDPGNPGEPENPGDPETPVDPVGPGNPGDPDNPGDPGTPVDPGHPGDPADPVDPGTPPPDSRIAVVPQVPSYLSAPAALLSYGDMLNDGLHERLGELHRNGSGDMAGEVFARYLGGQSRYSANLPFERYGYGFDQQVNALQIGGSVIAQDNDNGSLRAGWAVDQGTTRVTPHAVDGNSSAKYQANGVSGWITWQHGDGFWVDGVVGSTRYRGDVGTDLRGADVGRVRANGWTMSVEAGVPLAIGGDWTVEPRFQLKHQQLNFRDFRDADGLDVRLGTARQSSAALGARIARTGQPRFMPYASVDLVHTTNGDPMADVSSETWSTGDRFRSGRVGDAFRVAAGAASQLSENVQLYGEGRYQHFVGSYGMRGWTGNLGVRVTF